MAITKDSKKGTNNTKKHTNVNLKSKTHEELDRLAKKIQKSK